MVAAPFAPASRALTFDGAVELVRSGSTVALKGEPGQARTEALSDLEQRLQPDQLVLRVQMPARGDDAGVVMLAMLAARAGNDAMVEIQDPRQPWSSKVQHTMQAVIEAARKRASSLRAVVLIDDVRLSAEDEQRQLFDERANDVIATLAGRPELALAFTASTRPAFAVQEWTIPSRLKDAERERALAALQNVPALEAAVDTLRAMLPALQLRSPLELRLAAGLLYLRMRPTELKLIAGPRNLAIAYLTRLPRHAQLAIARLAALRMPCDPDTLTKIAQGRDEHETWLTLSLEETAQGLRLPELLVQEILRLQADNRIALDARRLVETHKLAAQFHERRFEFEQQRGAVPEAVRHELEVVYHLTQAGDAAALLNKSLWFVEQYDALGKVVGTRGAELYRNKLPSTGTRRQPGPPAASETLLRGAITAYDRALAHDPLDAYALHYRAYNLDILAEDANEVERGYQAAIEAAPDNVWHHSRMIGFLITRGRRREARERWADALRTLDGLRGRKWLYEELHRSLALLLLHRGVLDFAKEVLDDVDERYRNHHWFPALRQRLQAMRDAEHDVLVFPPWIPPERRWDQPRLVWGDEHADQWRPGRIESIDDSRVSIRYALRDDDGAVSYGRESLTIAQFEKQCEVACPINGTFVEILQLNGSSEEVIRCYREEPEALTPSLPAPFPPPDRYLGRAAARSPS